MNGGFFSRITIITIFRFPSFFLACFERQVLDLAGASLKVLFKPFNASRPFHVQGSRKLNLGGTLPRLGNFRNVEMSKRKHLRTGSRLTEIVES